MTDIGNCGGCYNNFFLFNKKLFIFTNLCGNVHKIKIHVNENLHESVYACVQEFPQY